MFHWTGSKIQVYAFYCVLSLLLTSPPQRELARKGESLSINRMLEELGGIRETMIVYPRRQGQRKAPTATCLTRTRATPILAPKPAVFLPSLPLGHTPHSLQVILLARLINTLRVTCKVPLERSGTARSLSQSASRSQDKSMGH